MSDEQKDRTVDQTPTRSGSEAASSKPNEQIPSASMPMTSAVKPKETVAAKKPSAPPAVDPSKIAGKTTSVAAASARARAAAAKKKAAVPDDTSPLVSRRVWIGMAWGAFSAASATALAATGRFMFPNVLNEPPQQFAAGFPDEYGVGVDERWKEKFGVWLVRTENDAVHEGAGFYALLVTCTHLGCTPNWLSAELKFKCPCHGSGFRPTGINFEGPAPRPLERARIVLADDGQILIDKARKFQFELGQWADPEAFLSV